MPFFVLLSVFLLFTTTSAHAGFEWVPPSQSQPAPTQTYQQPAPNVYTLPQHKTGVESIPLEPPVPQNTGHTPSSVNSNTQEEMPLEPIQLLRQEATQQTEHMTPAPVVSEEPIMKMKVINQSENTKPIIKKHSMGKRNLIINPFPKDQAGTAYNASAPVPVSAPTPVPDPVIPMPVVEEPQKIVKPQPAPVVTAPQDFSEVVGFGSDMPLALALPQVVPTGYSFSFSNGVNPGQRVSWDGGGRSWDVVVSEMISPLNLAANVHGKTVYIYSR